MKRGSSGWKFIGVALSIVAIAAMIYACSQTQGMKRLGKDVKSNWTGGLQRTVTVYNANGEVMKTYKGKIDLERTEGGIVKFDLNGQRIMYYNCYVEVIEEK